MIRFVHVSKSYGRPPQPVLTDINFEIEKGETAFFYGPAGAGKSTILKLIFGLERADAGQILVLGQNLTKLREEALPYFRRSIGFVFQDIKLFPRRTVFENVALAMKVAGASPDEVRRRTREVLQAVGLDHKQEQLPSMLSAGERQRVCIARAIVHHPPILLADEPTGNLDAGQAREIFRLLREINTMGATVVLAGHHRDWIERMNARTIKIHNGTIQADGVE